MNCSMTSSFHFSPSSPLAKKRLVLPVTRQLQILTVAASLTASGVALAQTAAQGAWTADPSTSCKVWNPNPQGGETIRWSGACVNGSAQGHGSLQWFKDKRLLEQDEGEWRDGRQTGQGTQVWQGGRYEGQLQDGQPDGHGVWTLPTGRYEGEFRNGKPNGKGALSNANGTFDGIWKDGCFRDKTRRAYMGVPSSECP
jgi:MORN repeat